MTNEEIIRNTDIGLDLESSQIALYPVEIKKILNLARKDEKNKVIEEIEPILKKIWELAYGKTVNYIQLRNDLRAEYKKLNQLKNP